jgi:hypothetical protein
MKTKILVILGLCMLAVSVYAEDLQFSASAPEAVVEGDQFRVTYTLNKEGKDLRVPDMSDFDVLMGPSTSRSSSMQITNGSMTKTMSISYTYILAGKAPGKYVLAPATILVDGQKYSSNQLEIKVLPPDQKVPSSSSTQSSNQVPVAQSNTSANISDKQIFVRQTLSKTKVYEQEAILVTYKLYTRNDVSNIPSAKFPEFKGFYVQEIDLNKNQQFVTEHYDGLNYNTYVLKQCLLYPQQSGTLNIESGKLDIVLRVRVNNRAQSIFDSFFDSYQEVRKTLNIPSAKVEVMPLPSGAPARFSGAVGTYKLSSTISSIKLKANDAVTIKVAISGNGNLKLLKNPEITFPTDFDIYDPKVETNIKAAPTGTSGNRNIEYLAIPRFGGDFEIPSAEFTYFDLNTKKYKTLLTPAYSIEVEGTSDETAVVSSNYVSNKESVKNIGSDIRYISSDLTLKPKNDFFLGSASFWMAIILPFIIFLVLVIVLQKQARENANVALRKTKRANKQARKRLKAAEKYMKASDKAHFYEETMKALWGYLSDKLLIPVADLTKDNVQDELLRHNASQELIDEFLKTLSDCEFARFSPVVEEDLSLENIFERSLNLIGQLENTIK